jgi:hypothetical protein
VSKSAVSIGAASAVASVPDHTGVDYIEVLRRFHQWLKPATYFEIGTSTGYSLSVANCASVAVDPKFGLKGNSIVGKKPLCAFYQMSSDAFFRRYDPTQLFDGPIDLAFLDGMHYCEYLLRDFANTERHARRNSVIALHDCIPVEISIAQRSGSQQLVEDHRKYWWAGDVWRTVVALRKHRPELSFTSVDSPPTGLVLITNLHPQSSVLVDDYTTIVREMMSLSLEEIGIEALFSLINLEPTSVIDTQEKMSQRFWL